MGTVNQGTDSRTITVLQGDEDVRDTKGGPHHSDANKVQLQVRGWDESTSGAKRRPAGTAFVTACTCAAWGPIFRACYCASYELRVVRFPLPCGRGESGGAALGDSASRLMGVLRESSFYTQPRHLHSTLDDWETEGSPAAAQEWRIRSSRTYGGVLAVCLNVEVEPPDCPFPRALQTGAGRQLCGIDPYESNQADPRKVVARIGSQLEAQYDQIVSSRSTVFKQCLDPTLEQVHRNCRKLRREAKDDTLLFHFNGHGVPAPSLLGAIVSSPTVAPPPTTAPSPKHCP